MSEDKSKKSILVVDDEPKNVKLMIAKLTGEGYRVETATSGPEALRKIEKEEPGLVLLDIMMPEMDGLDVLKVIKKNHPDVPVAMVTAVWDEDEAKKCMEAGAYEYVTKPINMEQLKLTVLIKLFPTE